MKIYGLLVLAITFAAATHPASAEDNEKKTQAQKQHRGHQTANINKMAGANQAHIKGVQQGNRVYSNAAAQNQFHPQRNGATGNPDWAQSQIRGSHVIPRVTSATTPVGNVDPIYPGRGTRSWADGSGNPEWRNRNGDGNRTWESNGGQHREINRARWDRSHHDRAWYRSHYSRFARFGGGYYYWNSGFWYPAYGYDPYFTTYSYDAPVYSYNDLEPGQVIGNVQEQLQRGGYYRGSLDGQFGPETRRALLDYQRDNGLETTGEIDETTLDSLGLQ